LPGLVPLGTFSLIQIETTQTSNKGGTSDFVRANIIILASKAHWEDLNQGRNLRAITIEAR